MQVLSKVATEIKDCKVTAYAIGAHFIVLSFTFIYNNPIIPLSLFLSIEHHRALSYNPKRGLIQ